MGIQRAAVLYPVNSTTIYASGAADVRLLDSAQAGADDDNQTCTATHTQDGVARTFNPNTLGRTSNDNFTVFTEQGYALRLTEDATPDDDANCNAYIPAGVPTLNMVVAVNQAGGTYVSGTYQPNWGVGLFRYNPSTHAATFLGAYALSGGGGPSWNIAPVGGDLGTFKQVSMAFTVGLAAGVELAAGEVLLAQFGVLTGTIPNPTLGTATWTYTLRVDHTNTNITWAAGQGIRQTCALTSNNVGKGVPSRNGLASDIARSAIGKGVPTSSKAVIAAKSFTLDGRGIPSRGAMAAERAFSLVGRGIPAGAKATIAAKAFSLAGNGIASIQREVGIPRSATGVGVPTGSKATIAAKAFTLDGRGVPSGSKATIAAKDFSLEGKGAATVQRDIGIPRDAIGVGVGSFAKAVAAAKSIDVVGRGVVSRDAMIAALLPRTVVGNGVVTNVHPVQAYRSFDLAGKGEVSGRVELPLGDVPEGGGGTIVRRKKVIVYDKV